MPRMGLKKGQWKRLKLVVETRIENKAKQKAELVKESVCSWSFFRRAFKTCCLVIIYYVFSISLTFYNKRFISEFKFPISITMVHLITKFILAGIARVVLSWRSGKPRTTLPWGEYAKRIAPPGIATSIDIGLSNWSFEFITVTLYTMTKSTAIIFIMVFAIFFRLEKPRRSLIVVVLFISLGLFMFSFESTQFNLTGFLLVLFAAFTSGIRWSLSQLVLQKKEIGLNNPIDMMYHIQPWMLLVLLVLSTSFEGVRVATTVEAFGYKDPAHLFFNFGMLMIGAFMAFFLEFSEFLLVLHTSSLTLSVSGVFKEVLTFVLAAVINGDKLNRLNTIGLIICLAGISFHVILKAVSEKEEIKEREQESIEMLLKNGEANRESEPDEEEDYFNVRRDRPKNR